MKNESGKKHGTKFEIWKSEQACGGGVWKTIKKSKNNNKKQAKTAKINEQQLN